MSRVDQSVESLSYRLDDRDFIPRRGDEDNFSVSHRVQTGSETYIASYPMGTGRSFPVGRVVNASRWPPTSK
jgi:hypothetical protein